MSWDNLLSMVYFFFFLVDNIYFIVCLLNIFTCNFIVLKQFGPPLGGIVCCVGYLDVSTLFFCWANSVCGVT